MDENKNKAAASNGVEGKMPAGTPWSALRVYPAAPPPDPTYPPASEPPRPSRSGSEMRTEFPPELPTQGSSATDAKGPEL